MRIFIISILTMAVFFLTGCDQKSKVIKIDGTHFIRCVGQENVMASEVEVVSEKIIKFRNLKGNTEGVIVGGSCIVD